MAKITLIAPDGLSGISVQGFQIDVVDGTALVDEQFVPELISHGFQTQGGSTVSSGRAELIQMLAIPMRSVAESLPDDVLRDFAAVPDNKKLDFWERIKNMIKSYPSAIAAKAQDDTKAEVEKIAAEKAAADKAAADAAKK